MQNLETNGSD